MSHMVAKLGLSYKKGKNRFRVSENQDLKSNRTEPNRKSKTEPHNFAESEPERNL